MLIGAGQRSCRLSVFRYRHRPQLIAIGIPLHQLIAALFGNPVKHDEDQISLRIDLHIQNLFTIVPINFIYAVDHFLIVIYGLHVGTIHLTAGHCMISHVRHAFP